MANVNVLSDRYATSAMNRIFSPEGTVLHERELWLAVMKAQRSLGMNIPLEAIQMFERGKDDIRLDRMREIERVTRHDIKARIQAFIEVAGAKEYIHLGMTSRDLTDNVEQMQNKQASRLVFGKYVAVLDRLVGRAEEYQDIILTARTHHQAAQPTLLGRRFAMWAEELLEQLLSFEEFIDAYPLRGMKGPVGTQFDMLTLLKSKENVETLEREVARHLGFSHVLDATGQVYPRSLDYALLSHLGQLAAGPENFGLNMRLMAGYELVTEGFKEGQVGSSAMPHKMNTRSSERICGLGKLVKMYADGASRLSGDQWEEGDVSCSSVRRVILSDAFYSTDGICETTLTVLEEMGQYPIVIEREVDRYLPFMATTEILTMAVQAGIGRESAHRLIKKHAVAEALRMRSEGAATNDLAGRLAAEPLFAENGITYDALHGMLKERAHFIGSARDQIGQVRRRANELIGRYPAEATYQPGEIL